MHRRIALFGVMLTMIVLTNAAMASAQGAPQRLRPDEYSTVALIYNEELSALGERALFPICIDLPAGIPTKPLLQYLRRGGFLVSDEVMCVPAMAPGGQHHPKDYPHGLLISVGSIQRDAEGALSMHVDAGDLTLRPGEHLATLLRRGTYHFKQDDAGEWKIISYAKEYDVADDKGQDKCNCAQPSPTK